MSTNEKPRDVQVLPVAADTLALRSRSWNRLRFEIEYALEQGTTANSYLIQGDAVALIDPPGESFTEIFLAALKQKIDLAAIDYVILGHTNLNRIATLKAMLTINPHITVVCSNPAASALKATFAEKPLNLRIIKASRDEGLDLGKGHKLAFVPIPTPRWPDGMATYDGSTEVLYTDKFYGAHICAEAPYDLGWEDLLEDRRYYFDCLMAPNARQVEVALEKLDNYPARFYAPNHGPFVVYGFVELRHAYQEWSKKQQEKEQSVALIYASAYGNTATLAQAIARGITKAGVAVDSINAETTAPDEIRTAVEKSAGFVIGSPTLGGHAPTQIQTALGIILSTATKTKTAGVFGSFGWSGEAIDLLESKLKDAGYRFGFDTIRCKFKPTDVTLKLCEESGTDFAQSLKKAKRAKATRTPASAVEQAVGRLVGSLCIVTAKQGDVASAMLASWVAQATFNPPGFTVAVSKERAVEALMYPGNPFVLNILAEGQHLGPMKHFLKPFGPGEDRFAGIETDTAENGVPVLKEGIAYLECEVSSRMDCGDHWVVYATVTQGNLLQPNEKTAVHHRKSGTHY